MRLIFAALFFAGIHSSHTHAQQDTATLPPATATEAPVEKAQEQAPKVAPRLPVAAPAIATGPCQNPLSATRNWLDNLQDKTRNTTAAIECTEQGSLSNEQREDAVIKIKKVFDVRGLFLHFEDIPTSNEYIDPNSGRHKYVLAETLPAVFLEKRNNAWVFPVSVLRNANGLYKEALPLDVMRLIPGLPSWMLVPLFGIQGFTIWQLSLLVLILLVGLIVRTIVGHLITGQVKRATKKLGWIWGEDVIHLAALPLGTLSMAGVLAIGVPALQLPVKLSAVAMIAVRTLAAVAVVLLLYRAVDLLAAWMRSKAQESETKLDDQLVPLVQRALKVAVVLVGIVFVLQNLNVDVASLLAGLGIGGLAFALAAKDTVSNLFGSITIFLDKPFAIGDWVSVAGVEGVVEEVGFRSTRVRTFYSSLVSIPNSKFTEAVVDNFGLRQYRRCSIRLGVAYDTTPDQMEAFCNGIRAIIKSHPATRKDCFEVHFCEFGDFSLNIMVYFFFEVPSWTDELRSRHEIYLDFLRVARDLGVGFAFPTQTLHVDSMAGQGQRFEPSVPSKGDLESLVDSYSLGGGKAISPGPRLGKSYYFNE
jgi:MscS family membrane protein